MDLRNRVLDNLRYRWFIGGKIPFECSLEEIAKAVGEKRKYAEKIMRYIDMSESGGYIIVQHGGDSSPNRYEFKNERIKDRINEIRTEMAGGTQQFEAKNSDLPIIIDKIKQELKEKTA